MACTPPFCRGTGGFCACNCKCCPPPYVESISATFQCGSPQDIDDAPTGCDCVASFRMRNSKKAVNFPKFNHETLTSPDGEFVFALQNEGDCSIPCTTTTVTLTTTGCGFELDGSTIYTVGSGTVTATADPGSGIGNCQILAPKINGLTSSGLSTTNYSASDCEELVITVSGTDALCCPCCQVGLFASDSDDEGELPGDLPMRRTTKQQGYRTITKGKAITRVRLKAIKKTLPPTSL